MIKIDNIETFGWEAAIRGMRNPMNSWALSDTCVNKTCNGINCNHIDFSNRNVFEDKIRIDKGICIGRNDAELMLQLAKAGSDHAKFRRMINVTMDILAPLYWWKEFDTYKVGTVANSTSTMHKIHAREFTIDDFSHEYLINWQDPEYAEFENDYCSHYKETNDSAFPLIIPCGADLLTLIIERLNIYRELYLETDKKIYWWQMIQLLPSSYNQLRTVQLNYEVLSNIYHARKDHKLDEWRIFCEVIEILPYSRIITLKEA